MEQQQPFIWNYVKDLLHQHDCVIVPGFGGFVCNKEAARIDHVSHVITPPSRKVVFNQNLKHNDGLLAGYLSQKELLNYTQAIQFIDKTIADFTTLLNEKKSITIDLFGSFRLNAEANYVFIPDKRNNYLISSYGLNSIQAQLVSGRSIKLPKARIFKEKNPVRTIKPKRNVWPSVLAGVLIVLLSVNGYIFFSNYSVNDLHIGSTNTMSISSWFDSVFNKSTNNTTEIPKLDSITEDITLPQAPAAVDTTLVEAIEPTKEMITAPKEIVVAPIEEKVEVKKDATISSEELSLETYAPYYAFASHYATARTNMYIPHAPVAENLPTEVVTEVTKNPEVEDTKTTAPHLNTTFVASGYYVIGGVFCKEKNAKKFLQQLEASGFAEAELLMNEHMNCKRVSYKRFQNRKEAEQFCNQIQASTNPDAWVLVSE